MAFDAIVIGTGFGGTIAAVQLVAKGKSVLLLERGTFWRSPYPLPPITNTSIDAFGNWAKQNNPARPLALWDALAAEVTSVAHLLPCQTPHGLPVCARSTCSRSLATAKRVFFSLPSFRALSQQPCHLPLQAAEEGGAGMRSMNCRWCQ